MASQGSGADPPVEAKSSPTLTPAAVPDSVVDTPASKDGDVSTDPMDVSDSVNRVNGHNHGASNPSFSYNVPPNVNTNSESPRQFTSNTGMINSPGSSAFPRPSVPGVSASSGPSFSYNIQQADNPVSGGGQLFQPRMAVNLPESEGSMNASLSSTSSQLHVSGQLARPTFFRGMPPPSSVAVPRETSSNAANFSYNGHQQLLQNDQSMPSKATGHLAQGTGGPSASHVPHPGRELQDISLIVQTNSSPQQPFYDTYASNPPMMAPLREPGSSLNQLHIPLSSVPPSDAQPPGTSYGVPGVASISPVVSNSMPPIGSGMLHELPPGTDNSKNVSAVGVREESVAVEQVDAWSAHRTETGIIYYYNSVTGQSTYQKPAGFKGEPDKGYSQPTPISWEKCAGTDWSLVTTNDGKRYYYNAKTKLSSWQIPTGVSELKKKQEIDALKEELTSVPNAITLPEKGSAPISFSAPVINTCGRDAISPAVSGVPVSSSALDLIKKKLQDSTTPATSSHTAPTGPVSSELNGSAPVDQAGKGSHSENGKDKEKDENADGNLSNSSSDSEDVDSGPTNEDRAAQFKEMLKDRGVAPFSKWEKELLKFVFDPRFKAIPSYSAHRALFDHFVRTRAEEERKEKRAAHKAAIEGYKQLLDEAKEDIDHNTDYQTFKRKLGYDSRFEALDRKERESLLNERVLALKRSVEEEARAKRATSVSSFKSMLRENKEISETSRWSKEKLRERERALRKRKEREEQEVERVRSKACRKEAIESYQALLISWTDAKPKLKKDHQGRAANPSFRSIDKLFREHIKSLYDVVCCHMFHWCAHEYKALLADVITTDADAKEYEDGKIVFNSRSTAKWLLKDDVRYNKMLRKDRESLWRRHVDDLQRKRKPTVDQDMEPVDSRKHLSRSRRTYDRR
ncbi:pre-mRNA-processing protein 40C isoform X1 [Tanacetum coccineum]|uniref:Pre-mRNA-processing protein 40C isoform X1 n=1 Tax=Tanacetum coccineum TaxID=301880 RepID=A0ABQ5G1I8_9ASTR